MIPPSQHIPRIVSGGKSSPVEELSAIELTPAPVEDPRWEAIAWENGCSDCVG